MIQTSSTASSSSHDLANTPHQSWADDSQSRGEQRDDTRYRCQGNVEFVTEDSGVRTFAKLTHISFGGCYVEMTATSAPGAAVHLAVEVSGKDTESNATSGRRSSKKRVSKKAPGVADEGEFLNLLGKLIVFAERKSDALASGTADKDTSGNQPETTSSNRSPILARLVSA